MAESIGEKLRLARETRGIALRDISEQTRISMRYLEAIETNDYRRLPGGIFNRSFIRAYAKFVGYDEMEAIEEYGRTMREQGESGDDVASKPYRSMVYTDDSGHSRSPLVTLLLAVVILAILSLCVWAALRFYQNRIAPRGQSHRTNQRVVARGSLSATRIRSSIDLVQESLANIQQMKEEQHEFSV